MTALEFLSVALSFVLGLAVTLVITSFLAAFRNRHQTSLDWLPIAWALLVLAYQMDFWWELYQIVEAPGLTMAAFGVMLTLALMLSFAGGLVLPGESNEYPRSLTDYFQRDGRWGLGVLAAYNVLGTLANHWLFDAALLSGETVVNLVGTALILVTVLSNQRRIQELATVLFAIEFVIYVAWYVPKSY